MNYAGNTKTTSQQAAVSTVMSTVEVCGRHHEWSCHVTTLVCRLENNWLSESGIEFIRRTVNWDTPRGLERVYIQE